MPPPPLPCTAANHPSPSFGSFDAGKFSRDGYFVIPNFLPPETVSVLRQRVIQLLDKFSLEGHPMTKFSTGEKEAHVGDEVNPSQHSADL